MTLLTYDDLLATPEDGKRYEIISGQLFVNGSCTPRHQAVVGKLLYRLHPWLEAHDRGEVLLGPLDVVFDRHNVVAPDLMVVSTERADIVGEKHIQGPPDIVIEVVSEETLYLDEVLKLETYDRFGVAEYWTADPEIELVTIYRRKAGKFERVETGGIITTPLFPGFELDVRKIF